jgi:hypothetical protein
MSIPLDRLYHYIESVACEHHQDNVLIYHFFPHGSKKIEDLVRLKPCMDYKIIQTSPQIICNDQEPLNYNFYKDSIPLIRHDVYSKLKELNNIDLSCNLRYELLNIYDKCILLHSEQNSTEVKKYADDQFVPVYYWSHALIALDWFRYAQHTTKQYQINKSKFLIYNRAWSGTREYRVKFADLLIDNHLVNSCKTTFNATDPELLTDYQNYKYTNCVWQPKNNLSNYFNPTDVSSSASASFDINDYINTNIEVVLETLFDDSRVHLTEKSLRPIACGHPFILAATSGSLEYLRQYGFKTFSSVFDESYDLISDPEIRLQSVINTMKQIDQWSDCEFQEKNIQLQNIAEYNRRHFFSNTFFQHITNELKVNLHHGLQELYLTNTGKKYIHWRKTMSSTAELKSIIIGPSPRRTKQDITEILKHARKYYNRYLKTLNK